MGKDSEAGGEGKRKARAAGYRSARKPKLKRPAPEPPPLPALAKPGAYDGFGEAEEDGLHLIAALETLDSLEPVFGDEFDAEASVTIISPQDAGARLGAVERAARQRSSLRDRLGRIVSAPVEPADPAHQIEVDADDPVLFGPVEEAEVQIILLDASPCDSGYPETAQARDLPVPRPPRLPTIKRKR